MSGVGDTGWPAYVDDSGAGADGTILTAAFFNAQKTAIDAQIVAAGNPAVKPGTITDEVVTARGNKANLAARLAGVIDANGLLIPTTDLSPVLGNLNLVANSEFLIWPSGDTSAPGYFSVPPFTTYQRCGTGLADTNTKVGDFCVLCTVSASGSGGLNYVLAGASSPLIYAYLRGRTVSYGAWVLCFAPNAARLVLADSTGSTAGSYHTGSGTWEWLTVSRSIDPAAVTVNLNLNIAASNSAYYSGPTAMISTTAPATYQPAPMQHQTLAVFIPGVQAVAADRILLPLPRNAIVRRVQLSASVAPTGADLIVDVLKGRAGASMFTAGGRPRITAAAFQGSAPPDGATYSTRCFLGTNLASVSIAQIGSGVAGSDLIVEVEYLSYMRPLEALLPYNV